MLHEGMLCDLIQGHGHRGPKVAKMTHFKIFFTSIHVIKRLMVKYSKTVLKNSLDLFLIVFLLRHYMTVKVRLLQQLQSTAQHLKYLHILVGELTIALFLQYTAQLFVPNLITDLLSMALQENHIFLN